jgi:hypothetical protein
MGHKGVSKRKPGKTKSTPFSKDKANSSVASLMTTSENQPARVGDTGKTAPATKDGAKSSSTSKKKNKKG